MRVFIERVDRFADFPSQVAVLFQYSPQGMDGEARKEMKRDCSSRVVNLFKQKIADVEHFDYEHFVAITQDIKRDTGCKGRDLFHPLRIALTAQGSGLDLDKFIPLVEEGARLNLPRSLKNCRQRVFEMLDFLKQSGSVRNEETES